MRVSTLSLRGGRWSKIRAKKIAVSGFSGRIWASAPPVSTSPKKCSQMGGKSRILGLFGPKYGFQGGAPPLLGPLLAPKGPQQGGTPALGGGRASIAIFFIAIEAKSRFWPFFALFWQKMAKNGSGRNGMRGGLALIRQKERGFWSLNRPNPGKMGAQGSKFGQKNRSQQFFWHEFLTHGLLESVKLRWRLAQSI